MPRLDGELHESEHVLEDDYPVFWDYLYVADGKVIMSPIKGTVAQLKRETGAKEIRRCAMVERGF